MNLRTLAEIRGEVDKEAVWTIKNVVLVRDKKPTLLSVKLTDIQIAQYATVDEFVQECGGPEDAVKVLNQLKVEAAMTVCSQRLRYTKRGPVADVIKKALEAAKTHVFSAARERKMSPAEFRLQSRQLLAKGKPAAKDLEALVKRFAGL